MQKHTELRGFDTTRKSPLSLKTMHKMRKTYGIKRILIKTRKSPGA